MNKEDEIRATRATQLHILRVFKAFREICENSNLRYFAIGGTCIGAVRHRGFIPWDDDIDVPMPYEDLQKLRNLKSKLKFPFELYECKNHQHYINFFLKMQDVSTTFIESSVIKYPDRYTGVYIDIMPVYGMPNGKISSIHSIVKYAFYKYFNNLQRMPLDFRSSLFWKSLWVLNLPIKKLESYSFYSERAEKMLSKHPFEKGTKIIFGFRWNLERLVFDYADFSDYIEMPFEDTTIRVPIGYDHYLRQDFGDYMQLPPEEEQVSCHPTAIIDLHRSYKEYQKEGILL